MQKSLALFWIFGAMLFEFLMFQGLAFSQDVCSAHESSVYCGRTWKAYRFFLDMVRQNGMSPKIQNDGTPVSDCALNVVPDARALDPLKLANSIKIGMRWIILDKSSVSETLFSKVYLPDEAVYAVTSPELPAASHINGSRDLPVFTLGAHLSAVLGLGRKQKYEIAWNHPVPLYAPHSLLAFGGFIFAFPVPQDLRGLAPDEGALVVIRDESMMTNLMMAQFSNSQWMAGILKTMCTGRHPCSVCFWEPESRNIPYEPESQSRDYDAERGLPAVLEMLKNLRHMTENLPGSVWPKIAAAAVASWCVIFLFVFFPIRRHRL